MIEIVVKFSVDNVSEMEAEVKAFLDTLRAYCASDVDVVDENATVDEADMGYRYNNGEPINNHLRWLCDYCGVSDWRKIPFGADGEYCPLRQYIDNRMRAFGFKGQMLPYEIGDVAKTLGGLTQLKLKDLKKTSGVGKIAIDALCKVLGEIGLSLKI